MWWFLLSLALAQTPAEGEATPVESEIPSAPAEGLPSSETEAAVPEASPDEAPAEPTPEAEVPVDAAETEAAVPSETESGDEAAPASAIEPTGEGTEDAMPPDLLSEETPEVPVLLPEDESEPRVPPHDRDHEAEMADGLYREALEAWEWGRWQDAYELASRALTYNPDDEPAKLLQGFALSRLGDWEEGLAVVRPLQDSGEVGAHARFWVRRHDRRWTRSDYALSFSALLRNDRDTDFPVWKSGIGVSLDVPVVPRERFDDGPNYERQWLHNVTVRVDATTPIHHRDLLGLYGVGLGAVPVYHLRMRTWSLHGGVGPLLHFGYGESWAGRFWGVFPGVRGTVGLGARMSRRTGMRLQMDYDLLVGARRFLEGVSHGPVLRWSYVVFL
ncbi:MAG: hypothetical protein EP330_24775 [Deltaproteobacteria bacterium]|nr:MAG: hypothetical protein EP330_24775 [Deltaproteobacteria bacterium]